MTTTLNAIRPAAVAGAFYAAGADVLASDLRALLAGANPAAADARAPKALIAPHAGYIYSGPIAANAYALLAPLRGRIERVVLLGPAHRVAIEGLALPGVDGLQTPLGIVPVDAAAVRALTGMPQVVVSRDAHAQEHSLEVHLPFLQTVLGSFSVVPLVVGRASTEQVAEVIERLWGGDETLIVVSSDLSHYLSYGDAQATDRQTTRMILQRESQITHHQACGATPVNALLSVARSRGLTPELLDLRNSGDTAGDHSRVVGYVSIGFFAGGDAAIASGETAATATPRGETLIRLARAAIGDMFGLQIPADPSPAFLQEPGASFVTLTRNGRLRGCIGSLEPHRTLLDDIKGNAKAAAFLDPRFTPLTQTEFATTSVEVSLVSPAEPIPARTEEEALRNIRPNIDGLILQHGSRRATFLPQVWETLPQPLQFLRELKCKAGLDPTFWAEDISLLRYTVEKFNQADVPGSLQ
ncbi:MAG: AmmeMemoRadiSam system protein B [Betaproteobacteria bacterium]